ncbi:DEAD/DEAH box helicase family protein [Cryobacterium sp. Y62]|uniref:DEAD/DEAH box helicase family protein n=1 Tax=Cryobacterium sp. Y62 TaxID=2048284 RepID=UPI0011B0499D|nr:DEAD/DEAH box helicase family protein [Cryobacterium sp. Y62]
MVFKARSASEVTAPTPEKLFPLLSRTGSNSDALWSQQTDLLREYAATRLRARDLAIELPTGTGKTLTGLLIADWRRRQNKSRAIFACPTVQLVRQVLVAAEREGIPAVDLSGSHKLWGATEKSRYERGQAIAVVPYSSVFNTSPKLIDADVIVFDDSHAGEQYVSAAYTVSVSRSRHPEIYSNVIEAVKPGLGAERYAQLIMNSPGPGTRQLIDPLVMALRDDWLAPIDHALIAFNNLPKEDREGRKQSFTYTAVREHLSVCVAYVTWDRIELRPMTPPTFENSLFTNANQRVYLSATLGTAGELERAFGRPKVKRLALPPEAPTPKSGRRFLVFPHLVPDCDPDELTRQLLSVAGKAIVITPSDRTAVFAEAAIIPDQWSIFRKSDVEDSFDDFAKASSAAAILANRYDGIDLPGDACRVVALYGFPGATSLQEQFLSTRARSKSVIDERVRSRVIQGTGRCTRGPRDWALVIVADPETTSYLSQNEVRLSLDEDLQAEVLFGLEQSETSAQELTDKASNGGRQNLKFRSFEV